MADLSDVIDNLTDDRPDLPVSEDECPCYKCSDTEYLDSGNIKNNMEYHTYGQECDDCGTARTEYRDFGTKGRYVCPECR